MTGYESKRAAAQDKLGDDDALTIAYQSGYYDGKKAAQRPWVGLTAEEVDQFHDWKERTWSTNELVRHIESVLRSKNT